MIEYKSGEELGFMKKSPHSPECVSSMIFMKAVKLGWRSYHETESTYTFYLL